MTLEDHIVDLIDRRRARQRPPLVLEVAAPELVAEVRPRRREVQVRPRVVLVVARSPRGRVLLTREVA